MGKYLEITIGYEMEEDEMLDILNDNNMKLEEFENEDAAYEFAAETKFDYGLGCSFS